MIVVLGRQRKATVGQNIGFEGDLAVAAALDVGAPGASGTSSEGGGRAVTLSGLLYIYILHTLQKQVHISMLQIRIAGHSNLIPLRQR